MNVAATGSVYTGYAQGYVTAISPGTNTLYLAVQGGVVEMDNSIPENSIELQYEPAALELPEPMPDTAPRNRLGGNPKEIWVGKKSTARIGKFGTVEVNRN
jgi:hypothetical protein